LGWSSKVWRRGQEIDLSRVSQVDLCLWKESKWENANEESMRSYNRDKERICAEKEKDISVIKRREGRGVWVYWRTVEKRVY